MVEVVQLWKLPDNFFRLGLEAQYQAVADVTTSASRHTDRRPRCSISRADDCLAVAFFLVTLGLPWLLVPIIIVCAITSLTYLKWCLALVVFLGLHPLPAQSSVRNSRLGLALLRYFSVELLVDRTVPLLSKFGTPTVECADYQDGVLPSVFLACPHGVFNYGAIAWCCIGRWVCGWQQYTGGSDAVKYVPGLRYMDLLCWLVTPDRRSIKRVLQERPSTAGSQAAWDSRRGGMLGMVPDGIAGAFRSTPGVDELIIGRRRGLMRICLEEGASINAAWLFGTTDLLNVVQDPFGVMEWVSRKLQSGIMYYYGRWYLPLPHRVAVSVCVHAVKVTKTAAPTEEEVQKLHREVYGGLTKVYEQQKCYAGYPDRQLKVIDS